MTDSPDDERTPPRDRDSDSDADPDSELVGIIRQVLEALVEAERSGGSDFRGVGRRPGSDVSVTYGFSGRIGGLPGDPDEGTEGERDPSDRRDSRSGDDGEYLVDVREGDDEVVVVADLGDADVDEVAVGLADDRTRLVVRVRGEPIERIDLPWPAEDADSTLNHGVLEITLVPDEEGG